MFLFAFEIFVASICRAQYFRSSFFYLDILVTITMVLDLPMVVEAFNKEDMAGQTPEDLAPGGQDDVATVGSASRSSRMVRAAMLLRFNRLTKLTRLTSLFPRLIKYLQSRSLLRLVDEVLERRLRIMFQCFDEGDEGYISQEDLEQTLVYVFI